MANYGTRNATQFEHEEWSVNNSGWSGNEFDVSATVSFTGPENRSIEMFYAGGTTWKWRATFETPGNYSFTTSSSDSSLNGHTGNVSVAPTSDSDARGFVTNVGNKYARMKPDGSMEGWLQKIYRIEEGSAAANSSLSFMTGSNIETILDFIEDRGFNAPWFFIGHQTYAIDRIRWDQHNNTDPDLQTFERMEDMIIRAHARGMVWHFWRWGDDSRKQNAKGLPGGINGTVDKRATRYWAARLGPLIGWTLGHGYDLHEWISKSQVRSWFDYFQGKLDGFPHMLGARALNLNRSSGAYNGYNQGNDEYTGSDSLNTSSEPSYNTIRSLLNNDTNTPHMLEERCVLNRNMDDGQFTNEDTYDQWWWAAMAGGMGVFNGALFGQDPIFGSGQDYSSSTRKALKTHQSFWDKRFDVTYSVNNSITSSGGALISSNKRRAIVYTNSVSSVTITMPSGTPSNLPVISIDARETYSETSRGTLSGTTPKTINFGSTSNWAVAVGDFETVTATGNPPNAPSNVILQITEDT